MARSKPLTGWERVEREHELREKVVDEAFWRDYLTANPDVLHRLLADLYQSSRTFKAKPPTLDDLWELVAPKFSTEPFAEAVRQLLDGRSVRWLATQINVHNW